MFNARDQLHGMRPKAAQGLWRRVHSGAFVLALGSCGFATAMLAPMAAHADPADARDTLSACLAVQPDPLGLLDLFIAKGWMPVSADPAPAIRANLEMAMIVDIGTQGLDHTSPQADWTAFQAKLAQAAGEMLAQVTPWDASGGVSVLTDPATGNILMVAVDFQGDREGAIINCTYAATTAAMAGERFFPGPGNLPFQPGGFASDNPRPQNWLSRSLVNTLVVTADPDIIAERLGFRPDVTAVFWTNLRYDLELVTP